MTDFSKYFAYSLDDVQLPYFYIFLLLGAFVAFYLVIRSNARYKIELFFIAFYLITGNINDLLTVKIPGIGFFEIQPERFLFLLLSFFIARKWWVSRKTQSFTFDKMVPWFEVILYIFVALLSVSVIINSKEVGTAEAIKTILEALAFVVLMISLRMMGDKSSYNLIGKAIIIGAVLSSFISIVQFSIDPYFLRIGG